MSEERVPYRVYSEQDLPLIIGKTYYYAGCFVGTIENDFKCGLQVIEVKWTEEVDRSDLKYFVKLFGTRQEAQLLVDEKNNEMFEYFNSQQEHLKSEWQEKSKASFLTSNKWIWDQMGGNYLEWQEERIAKQFKTDPPTPEAMEQLEIATNRIILTNPDIMIPYLRKQGFNPQQMTMEEQRKVIGDMINEEIEALNSTDWT